MSADITRVEIEKVLRRGPRPGSTLADAVMALVQGDDPAVHVVRESDIAGVKVELDKDKHWIANGDPVAMKKHDAEDVRRDVKTCLNHIAQSEAVARRIEAEAALDPVEVKARELWNAAHRTRSWEKCVAASEEGTISAAVVRDEINAVRRIARHVLDGAS